MQYRECVILKNGANCVLRNGTAADGMAALAHFQLTHGETDYLLTYPDETCLTAAQEGDFLQKKTESARDVELLAFADGKLVAMAGIEALGNVYKLRHRAEFGISVERACWNLGVGRALTRACIECAKRAGYLQLELEVVRENRAAIALYESIGFQSYGRNPRAFRSRSGIWQETLLMRLELD